MSPFAKIDGLYFDPTEEPCDFYYQLSKDLKEKFKDTNIKYIQCEFDDPRDFYKALKDMEKYTNENITISGTSRERKYEMIINEGSDIDDPTKPSTVALAKKKKKKI